MGTLKYTTNHTENFSFLTGLEKRDVKAMAAVWNKKAFLLMSRLLLCYIAFIMEAEYFLINRWVSIFCIQFEYL